jgi:hypothetical protein
MLIEKVKGRDKEINPFEATEGVNVFFVNLLKNIIFSAFSVVNY